jgi:hypothetical protein
LIDTYRAFPTKHFPGQVLVDLAVAIADGAKSISDLAALRDTPGLFGPVASTATAWRALDRVDGDVISADELCEASHNSSDVKSSVM